MKKQEVTQIANTIEDCLNASTYNNVKKVVVNLSTDKEKLYISYVVCDDFDVLYVLEVKVKEEFANLNCELYQIHTVKGGLLLNSQKLQRFENAIKQAEKYLNEKDAE